ncbi:MAG: hypothetical protein RR719_09045 [Akkermansia sp.]
MPDDQMKMIEIKKSAPSDELTTKILIEWFHTAQPKWKRPADFCIGTVFLVVAVYSLIQGAVPFFAWLALAGAILSFTIAFGYIPFLAKSALKANKKQSSYLKEKTYRFYPDHMTFSYDGGGQVEIPLAKFTLVRVTDLAILFLIGHKLVLWFAHSDLSPQEEETIIGYLQQQGVEIDSKLK